MSFVSGKGVAMKKQENGVRISFTYEVSHGVDTQYPGNEMSEKGCFVVCVIGYCMHAQRGGHGTGWLPRLVVVGADQFEFR